MTVMNVVTFVVTRNEPMSSLRRLTNSPYWIACFTSSDGTRTNRSTKTSDKRDAARIAMEWEQAAKDARKGVLIESQARKVLNDILQRVGAETMNTDTVETYLNTWLARQSNQGTVERYSHTVDLFKAHLGKKSKGALTAITHNDLIGFVKGRQSEGVAPKTVSVDAKILNTAFNFARKMGFVAVNPVEKALTMHPLPEGSSEREQFTAEQVGKMLQTATGEWKTVILLGFYTGARLGDCAAMKWDNVKLSVGVIDFVPQKTRKKGKRVVVPIHPDLETHLQTIASTDKPETFLCPSLAEKGTSGKHGLSESFKRIMAKAGIDSKTAQGQGTRQFSKLSFHSLRHSFNSILANGGVTQETRMKLTGHSSVDINNDYTHLELPKLQTAIFTLPSLG